MVVVKLCGGLGNQMFEYAFGRALEILGKEVKYDISSYKKDPLRHFALDIFPNISIQFTEEQDAEIREKKYLNRKVTERIINRIIPASNKVIYEESAYFNRVSINNLNDSLLVGYFQDEKYFKEIRTVLLKELRFDVLDLQLKHLVEEVAKDTSSVSIHIRRGDYLKHDKIYGGICTEEYYKNAVAMMKRKIVNPHFYVFSDGVEWVRDNFEFQDAIYIDDSMFENKLDWYDMYLMSVCKNNIIANSTFSWWAAWLNPNSDKVVISPDRLDNVSKKCIAAEGWIVI